MKTSVAQSNRVSFDTSGEALLSNLAVSDRAWAMILTGISTGSVQISMLSDAGLHAAGRRSR